MPETQKLLGFFEFDEENYVLTKFLVESSSSDLGSLYFKVKNDFFLQYGCGIWRK